MAYSFGAAATHKIATGTGVTLWTTKMSVFARFTINAANTTKRELANFVTPSIFDWQFFLDFGTGGTNQVAFGYRDTGGSYHIPVWTSGFTAGSTHTLVGTIDTTLGSANVKIYADTDSTAKASAAGTLGPRAASAPVLWLGNHQDDLTDSLDGVLYEFGYWAGTALTGAQAAQLGSADTAGIPSPSHYYRLIRDATDLFGSKNGTVTGATLVDTTGTSLYAFPQLGANWVDYHSQDNPAVAATQALTIVGNRVQPLSTVRVNDLEGLVGVTLPDDHWAQITLTTIGAAGSRSGVGVRWAAAPDYNGYLASVVSGAPNTLTLYKAVDNGTTVTFTNLGTSSTAPASGNTLRVEAIGDQITAYLNDTPVIGPVTDATYTSGTAVIQARNTSDATQTELDEFYAGDWAAFTPTTLDPMALTWTGANLAVNAKTMVALTAADLAWTGVDLAFNARTQLVLDPVDLAWTGVPLSPSLDPMVLTWTGQELAVTGPGGPVATTGGLTGKQFILELRRRRRAGR